MSSEYNRILKMVYYLRRRWRTYLVLEGVLYTFAILLALVLLIGILSDNLFHLPLMLRTAFLAGLLALGGFLFYRRIMSKLLSRISPAETVLHIESRIRNMDNRLINSLQLGNSKTAANRKIVELILQETISEVKGINLKKAIEKTRARNYLIVLICFAMALIFIGLFCRHIL